MPISIVTAAFSAKYLDSVWDGIKRQTFKEWEWVFVIDGSAEAEEWYNKQDFTGYNVWKIKIDKNQKRYGLVSRNVGAMCASYNWILFNDDDNHLEEDDYIEEIVRVYHETGKYPYTRLHIVGKKPGSTVDRYKDTSLSRTHIDLGNLLYRKEWFLRTGYFSDEKNHIVFDADKIEDIVNLIGVDNFIKVDRHLYFRHKRY